MKVLHTSDWHLGRSLHRRKRYKEFSQMLEWMLQTIIEREIDLLLVAGDIFDTITPTNKAQELYYNFLIDVSRTNSTSIVIIAGNHDSPTLLHAPKQLLKHLHIHVLSIIPENIEDEVLVINDSGGSARCIVCAVPFLRDRDLRTAEFSESIEQQNTKLRLAVEDHYSRVTKAAQKKMTQLNKKIPLIAMGHLFTNGGQITDDDGVRDLYVGSLGHIESGSFPDAIDYLALGHLHLPQQVGANSSIRYSGSPIAMGFGESAQKKIVIELTINNGIITQSDIEVPSFQELVRISGNINEIEKAIRQLKDKQSLAWLEIEYTGKRIIADLNQEMEELIKDSGLEILLVKNRRKYDALLCLDDIGSSLLDLDEYSVFEKCMEANEIDPVEQTSLKNSYKEIVEELFLCDENAE